MKFKNAVEGYTISNDKELLDIDVIYNFLKSAYWARDRNLEQVELSIENSFCLGVYKESEQVGFARVITDYATFAYIVDVFILDNYRGKGLSKWLMKEILDAEELILVKSWLLKTKDAHGLYNQFDFKAPADTNYFMTMKK